VTFSHPEFAQRLGCKDVRTVKSAEESLVRRGWITVTPRRGMSNLTAVRIDRLPMVTAALPRKPSDAAQLLTRRYLNVLLQLRAKGSKPAPKIPHKKQTDIMEWTAQKMLNRSNGDVELVANKIAFAIFHPTLKNYARQGLYRLWKRWAQVEREFAAQNERIKEQTQ